MTGFTSKIDARSEPPDSVSEERATQKVVIRMGMLRIAGGSFAAHRSRVERLQFASIDVLRRRPSPSVVCEDNQPTNSQCSLGKSIHEVDWCDDMPRNVNQVDGS
jgi:hypothetical protein